MSHKKITAIELGNWLQENKVSKKAIFEIIDALGIDAIPSLNWRYEEIMESQKLLTELVNLMKLQIPGEGKK